MSFTLKIQNFQTLNILKFEPCGFTMQKCIQKMLA